MPVTTIQPGAWGAITPEAGGTRIEARGTGFYVSTDAAPVNNDFGTALAVASGESIFVDAAATAIWAHASQSVVPAFVYTTGGITQASNAH